MQRLLHLKGALPYLIAIFLNAFVDLGHKIVIQNTIFKSYDGETQVVLTALVNGLILLPFILLFSPAGHVADSYPKVRVLCASAWAAVAVSLGITAAYYQGWFWLAFAMTLLLAIQSAFYSPAKYGLVKGLFGKPRLAEANGLIQAVTIGAILAGTVAFTALFETWVSPDDHTPAQLLRQIAPLGWLLVLNSAIQVATLYRLPLDSTTQPDTPLTWQRYIKGAALKDNLQLIVRQPVIRLSIIGLATFWSVGQVLLAAFPAYAKDALSIDNTLVLQGILAASGIGIALGSMLASKLSHNRIETGLIPVGAVGVAVGLWCLPLLSTPGSQALNFVFIGMMGGLFIVPLNALIQFHAADSELGTVLAANNWIQNIAMLGFLVLTALFALAGVDSHYLLLLIATVAMVGGGYTIVKLPQSLVRFLLSFLLTRRYRVDVQGLQNLPAQGGVLLLGNHISWVDWAMVQIASPRPVRFVMLRSVYQRWYLNWFFKALGCIPIERGSGAEKALADVAEQLNAGEVVCLFPEGAISRTGQLGEFRRGYERACNMANPDVKIVPFYLRGLWGSQFSRSSSKLKELRNAPLHRSVVVAFGKPLPKDTPADVLKRRIFEQATRSWQQAMGELSSLPNAWIQSVKRRPGELALADNLGRPLNASQVLTASLLMAKRIRKLNPGQNVGLLLPTSSAGVIANMATLLAGKTLVNLNYTADQEVLSSALSQAEITTVFTSQRFVKKLEQRGLDVSQLLSEQQVVFLEDLQTKIGRAERLSTWLAVRILPTWLLQRCFCHGQDADATAAILFSSGSEGEPKGVMLSHRNLMANIKQTSDVLNTQSNDVVMGSLPLFHAFGLTVTQLLPLIEGLPLVCHPDPTDAPGIASAIAKYKVSLMFSMPSSLASFVECPEVHPPMLENLRAVIVGGGRLDEGLRASFAQKFSTPIYEGYGATETAPVASVNLPDAVDANYQQVQRGSKPGTVGMPLPGTSFKIVDPESFEELATGEAGMILISGPQVMLGYLNDPTRQDDVIKELDEQRWFVTGDKGFIDEDGFLTLIAR
ncbi:acyl-[acyl-carrier-protein]-phospholipid O-acyltransferase / long-chain-fatty-acid--[acyl-carrier-protein] ligase [Vreelandella subterranea]|uniref:Acyl-[acyl-carrier-protein]-phospholipid O-acyltransferase / long-chain-fatty-acid--[acyl-carrier-protein] ligase n=2 Tax=Vreelandella TaxID=3137766 RepID=A0A1H9SUC9_9GAMM|nr:acyl-[ACP]--phospholipid O-acyltransferase [Halomonas subterranea]SER88003.1 acyl-[acyl-carrier-protein]-phospholipid O-acyltransferase / long-chain-fatty-acid--[acyl-carrier-protein] ligase [Halomonas subterranea]